MERILHPVRPSRRRNALFSAVTVLFLVGGLLAGCNVAGGAGEQPVSPDDNPQSTQEPADNHWADLYGRPGGGVSSISDVDLLGDPLYPFSIPNRLLHGEWNGAGEPIPVRVSAPDDCYRPGGMTSIPVAVKIGQGDPQPDGFGLFVPEDHALTLTVDAIPDTISLSAAESGDIRYFEDIDGGTYAVLGYAVDVDSVPVYTLYARLDEVMVKNGEYADAGQELGKIRISGDDSSDTGFIGFQFFVAFHNTSKLFVLPGAAGAVSGTLETPLLFPSETSQFISRWSSSVADGDPYDHMAIDIDGSIGSGILAADRGVVAAAGFDPVRGYFVLLEHAEGFQTLYTHLSESFVEEGDEVARGDIIAAMGNSGQSTGPHLHFEVILDGAAQKPEDYLGNPPGR